MTTLDAGFFYAEHACVPMHLGALAVFEGPAPSYQELLGLYAARLSRVPRYRQVVRTAPLHVLRPAWTDDEHFELGYHGIGGADLLAEIFDLQPDTGRPAQPPRWHPRPEPGSTFWAER